MHVSCNQAGMLLARFARPEVQNCIEGLEQYSYSYEEAAEQAVGLRRLYELARLGEGEFGHMASVLPRSAPPNAHVHHHPLSHQQQQQQQQQHLHQHPHAQQQQHPAHHSHAVRAQQMQQQQQQPMGVQQVHVPLADAMYVDY